LNNIILPAMRLNIMNVTYNNIIPEPPKSLDKILRQNAESLAKRYPKDRPAENPLPIYIICCHGAIRYGVSVGTEFFNYNISGGCDVQPGDHFSTNYFWLPKDSYVFHSTHLGMDAICNTKTDNAMMDYFLGGRETRNSPHCEPNYVAYSRNLFGGAEAFACQSVSAEYQGKVEMLNDIIGNLCDEIYNNTKMYRFRRRGACKRTRLVRFKQQYMVDMDRFTGKTKTKLAKFFIKQRNRVLYMIKRAHYIAKTTEAHTYRPKIVAIFSDILGGFRPFKPVGTKPLMGCAGLPTFEKNLLFIDSVRKDYTNWHMGVFEISHDTEEYLRENRFTLTKRGEPIRTITKADRKRRIINNTLPGVLNGQCRHSTHLTKHEWITGRINATIERPDTTRELTLSEVVYEFGEGIYLLPNCSPLTIWNGDKTRHSSRISPYSKLAYKHSEPSHIIESETMYDYIDPISIPMPLTEVPLWNFCADPPNQLAVYCDIFKQMNSFNDWLRGCMPTGETRQHMVFRQVVYANCYYMNK
jgi:hypothetical protein